MTVVCPSLGIEDVAGAEELVVVSERVDPPIGGRVF